jgi:hypothetical protein
MPHVTKSEHDPASTDPSVDPFDLPELAHLVGHEFLAFMLALTPADLLGRTLQDDDERNTVASHLWTVATTHAEKHSEYGRHRWSALTTDKLIELFCTYDPDLVTTLATHCHEQAGGQRPDIDLDTATSLDEYLQIIACDCFGARLVGDPRQDHSSSSTRTHPLMRLVRERLRDDSEPITQLHRTATAATDGSERETSTAYPYSSQMEVYWSTGTGGSLHLRDVGDNIITTVLLDTDVDDEVLLRVAKGVSDNLDRARRLAAGEETNVKTVIGLGNVSLANDVEIIDLADGGKLRRPTVLDLRANYFADPPSAILELERPLRYNEARLSPWPARNDREDMQRFIADNKRRQQFVPAMVESAEALQEDIRRVRFAMVLSSPDSAVLAPTWLFNREYNPLTHSGANSHQPARRWSTASPTETAIADTTAATAIAEWTTKMQTLPDSLKIGRRRLLQATTERADAIDRFIDAVVAWESMFGAPQDSALRVTGSMALILEPTDTDARRALHKTLNTYYKIRSDLVHGSVGHDKETKEFKVADVPTYADKATRYAIDSFKHVLDDPELIALDSTARSKRILLGI